MQPVLSLKDFISETKLSSNSSEKVECFIKILWIRILSLHTIVAGGVISGKDTRRVIQRWETTGPVDLLCLGPNYIFGGSIIVGNELHPQKENKSHHKDTAHNIS